MKKANETKEQGKELKEIFALWKHDGEKGTYLTGKSEDGSIAHQGDNLTGEGDGDDEVIIIDRLNYSSVKFTASDIYVCD